ncbi:hypothetical protein HYS91_01795 [Candidatus Daviesbacteria bacterium]|nr:hypothetical protein [Candidatus Daviesbacteria bacterium]
MKKIAALLTTCLGLLALAPKVLATHINGDQNLGHIKLKSLKPGSGVDPNTALGTIIGNLVTIVIVLGALMVLVFLVIGAFNWITSGGEKEKVASARGTILNALIGLVVLAVAFVIANVAGAVVGISIFNLEIPTLTQD